MRNSEIKFKIELDNTNVPEKIFWEATDSPSGKLEETKAISLAIWDHKLKNTMKIALWAKDMPVGEMKLFFAQTIGEMAETIHMATGDEVMATEISELSKRLFKHIEETTK